MELLDNTGRPWHFAGSNDVENLAWASRIEAKVNELRFVVAHQAAGDRADRPGRARRGSNDEPGVLDSRVIQFLRAPTAFNTSLLSKKTNVIDTVSELDLDYRSQSLSAAYAIATVVKPHKYLQRLSLQQALDTEGLLTVCAALGLNCSLTHLSLSFNEITDSVLEVR